MANSTFSGPVRSESGFQTVSRNTTTGAITVTSDTSNALLTAGAGITDGTGTLHQVGVARVGSLIETKILLDITGLDSVATQGDIIGTGSSAAHIGQITAAVNGTIVAGKVECFEAPATGDPDIDIYSADEATGVLSGAITSLTNDTQLVNAGDHTTGSTDTFTAFPAANQYLYLVANAATPTAATYTAGKLLITLYGYDA